MELRLLIRWSGPVLIIGAIAAAFGAIIHPAGETRVYTSEPLWVPSHLLIFAGVTLLVFGFMGLYLAHARATGMFGLVAFVITTIGLVVSAGAALGVGSIVQPLTAARAPDLWELDGPLFTDPAVRLLLAFNYVWTVGLLLYAAALIRSEVRPSWPAWVIVGGAEFGVVRAAALATTPRVLGSAAGYLTADVLVVVLTIGVIALGWDIWSRRAIASE